MSFIVALVAVIGVIGTIVTILIINQRREIAKQISDATQISFNATYISFNATEIARRDSFKATEIASRDSFKTDEEIQDYLLGTWICDGAINRLIFNHGIVYEYSLHANEDKYSVNLGEVLYNPQQGYVVLDLSSQYRHTYTLKKIENGKDDLIQNGNTCKYSSSSTSSSSESILGTWLDTWAWTRTIVIKKINGTYKMTSTYSDGSGETITLGVEVKNGETRLYENPGNLYGDYMVIKSDGSLAFYDNQGFIYSIQP